MRERKKQCSDSACGFGMQSRSSADTAQRPELLSGKMNNAPAESRASKQLNRRHGSEREWRPGVELG